MPIPAPPADQTAEIRDPMALRDTSQGKLRRIQSPDESANAVAPAAGGEEGIKRETVRLKVVRDTKKGAPQIVPPAPEAESPTPVPLPAPPSLASGEETVSPASQTVKISLPGLKKAPSIQADSLKHATATVRVQEPPPSEEPAKTLKVAPPEESAEFRETNTATLKVGRPKVATPGAPAASPGGTIKIKPGPALGGKSAEGGDQNKQMTATLKVRPVPAAQAPAASEPTANKQVTATLKVRSGEAEAPDAASTVRITPPAVGPGAAADGEEGRPSLRLKRPGKPEADAASTVRLPGIDEAAEAAPDQTVRLPALPEEETAAPAAETAEATGPAIPPKKGLKLKPGRKHEEGEAPEAGMEGEPEEAAAPEEAAVPPAFAPRPAADGPGVVAAIGSIAACGALGTLVYRLVMDFVLHIQY
jgi:hypothetical protein